MGNLRDLHGSDGVQGGRSQQGIIANDHARIRIEKVVNNFIESSASVGRPDAETQLLREMATQVEGRLADALGNRVYIETDKVADRRWVETSWNGLVKYGDTAKVEECAEGTDIVEIFDRGRVGGKLLILGAPGAGKTTLLLRLARGLVARAIEDPKLPVPVLFELSTWKPSFKEIREWLVDDLHTNPRRKVRQDLAEQWVEGRRILPLLDGLDELTLFGDWDDPISDQQEICVQALNRFLPGWVGVPVVVCSRFEEYGAYESNLKLNAAVVVQPLSDRQIESFLQRTGRAWLWKSIREDKDMIKLEQGIARSPLMLTVLVLTSDNLPMELWRSGINATERLRMLFESFIAQGLRWERTRSIYHGKSLPWLGWLAVQLIKSSKTEFFIATLQPSYLATRWHRSICELLSGLLFGLFYALINTLNFLIYLAFGFSRSLPIALFFRATCSCLLLGLFLGLLRMLLVRPQATHTDDFGYNRRSWRGRLIDRAKPGSWIRLLMVLSLSAISFPFVLCHALALRITIWWFDYGPWNYSKFLHHCTRLGFLQRVGGGYRFTHALLRDHFAEHHNTIRPLKSKP